MLAGGSKPSSLTLAYDLREPRVVPAPLEAQQHGLEVFLLDVSEAARHAACKILDASREVTATGSSKGVATRQRRCGRP